MLCHYYYRRDFPFLCPLSQEESPELKNASEEVAQLFRAKSGSSASSPESTPDTTTLRQELRDTKDSLAKANEVGVALQHVSHAYLPSLCLAGDCRPEEQNGRVNEKIG